MIWGHWPLRELQEEVERLSPGLLDRLEAILPAIEPTLQITNRVVGDLYSRSALVRALISFAPDDSFDDANYRRFCLDRLPPEQLVAIGRELGVAGQDFAELRERLVIESWRTSEAQLCFLTFFNLPSRFLPRPPAVKASAEDVIGEKGISRRPLRNYQQSVLCQALRDLEPPRARLLIHMPTGSGKTRTAMEVVRSFLERDESPVVFWLAQSEELCEQAFSTFVTQWRETGRGTVRACRLWGKHMAPQSVDKPMFISAGFQKLNALLASGEFTQLEALRGRIALVIVDEAHRAIAPTYKRVIQFLTHGRARVVGLSATPGRGAEEEAERLVDLFFGSLVEIAAPNGESVVGYLRREGILSKLAVEPILSRIAFTLTPKERKHLEANFDFPAEFLERVGNNDIRNAEILARLITEERAGRQIICFACSVQHSRFIASALNFIGVEAAHLDGNTPDDVRRGIIATYTTGTLRVVCNFGVLSTGFDAPNTDAIMIARPTRSAILYSQMVGRGMRGPAMGGSEMCRLIDVRDNIQGMGSIEGVYADFAELWH